MFKNLFDKRKPSEETVNTPVEVNSGQDVISCPFCNSDSATAFRECADIVTCSSCGLIYLRTRPNAQEMYRISQEYADDTSYIRPPDDIAVAKQSGLRRKELVDEIIDGYLGKQKGVWLDVGCGWGALLDEVRERGFIPRGIELTRKNVDFAVMQLEIPVSNSQLPDSTLAKNSCTVISMIHVLQYMPQPRQALEKIYDSLEEGGLFCGIVPNIFSFCSEALKENWTWLDPTHHYIHFSPETLTRALLEAGFNVEKIFTAVGDYGYDALMTCIGNTIPEADNPEKALERIPDLLAAGRGEEIHFFARKGQRIEMPVIEEELPVEEPPAEEAVEPPVTEEPAVESFTPPMKLFRIRSFDEFKVHIDRNAPTHVIMHQYESDLQLSHPEEEFTVSGVSYPANQVVDFLVNYQYSNGKNINWRERLICPVTQLNNRLRSSIQILDTELNPYPDSIIYITEQVTSLYGYLKHHYPNLVGSEYLGNGLIPGEIRDGIRHEDMTNLSFPDQSLEYYLSFECFEHIPFYSKAIAEVYRTLKPGGYFLGSFPFNKNTYANLIKATMDDSGNIIYFTEPEYHGDPVGTDGPGILCYTIFGWEVLDEFRAVGFRDVYAVFFWSGLFGYLGGEQILFVARK